MSHTYRLAQLVFPFTHFVLGGSFISIKKENKRLSNGINLHYNGQLDDFITCNVLNN